TTMKRIQHVLQYGVSDYVIKQHKKYTRYEHCVGVWVELWTSNDPIIIECLDKIIHYKKIISRTTAQEATLLIKSKFRGLNPLIKINDTFERLTDLDEEYKKEYDRIEK